MSTRAARQGIAAGAVLLLLAALAIAIGWGAPTAPLTPTHPGSAVGALCRSASPRVLPLTWRGAAPAGDARRGELDARLELCSDTVVAGAPLKAVLVLENRTGSALPIAACGGDWVSAGVVRGRRTSVAGLLTELCRSSRGPVVPKGVSYVTVSMPTYSSSCDRGAARTQDGIPPCTARGGWPPALPPGRYDTSVVLTGLPLRAPMLRAVEVTLVRCAVGRACHCAPVGDRPVNGRWVPFC